MSKTSQEYVNFIVELLSPIRTIRSGRFFGGIGLSTDGIQFAMLMGNSLYFVVDGVTRPRYEEMGSQCFWYTTKKGRVDVKKYYGVPAELLEDPARLVALAEESIQAAGRAGRGGKVPKRVPKA